MLGCKLLVSIGGGRPPLLTEKARDLLREHGRHVGGAHVKITSALKLSELRDKCVRGCLEVLSDLTGNLQLEGYLGMVAIIHRSVLCRFPSLPGSKLSALDGTSW